MRPSTSVDLNSNGLRQIDSLNRAIGAVGCVIAHDALDWLKREG
jgi:hypothetical protein